jgi:hypothetical protein
VAKIIDRCPQILTYSMEQRVLPIQHKLIECGLKVRFLNANVCLETSRSSLFYSSFSLRFFSVPTPVVMICICPLSLMVSYAMIITKVITHLRIIRAFYLLFSDIWNLLYALTRYLEVSSSIS